MKFPGRFKVECIACQRSTKDMTKEHIWPRWLIQRTGTHATSVRFTADKRINPQKMTIPLCSPCNNAFGVHLEQPVSRIFDDLEAGHGLNAAEVELLIRWLWKFEGLFWLINNAQHTYSEKYTLSQRVLQPIDEVRNELTLAAALAERIDPEFGDAPMGVDSYNHENAIFVAGVFSRVALMVLLRRFEGQVPDQFSLYRLGALDAPDRASKLFHPKTGFATCTEAVGVTAKVGPFLSYLHDTRGLGHAA
jgi:hypothetical protein